MQLESYVTVLSKGKVQISNFLNQLTLFNVCYCLIINKKFIFAADLPQISVRRFVSFTSEVTPKHIA
jgi:hypothetical protein